jgi:hypothetical protein
MENIATTVVYTYASSALTACGWSPLRSDNEDGVRLAVEVVGQGTTTYTVDYGGGYRVLAEETVTGTLLYLYPSTSLGTGGRECLGHLRRDEWLPLAVPRSGSGGCAPLGVLARYYLDDATGYVRLPSPLRFAGRTEGTDDRGTVVSAWLFDPDGLVLERPQGPVSHLPLAALETACARGSMTGPRG